MTIRGKALTPELNTVSFTDDKGRTDLNEWMNNVHSGCQFGVPALFIVRLTYKRSN
jgi:hypothetical protein